MGVLYLARDPLLERPLAIKVLSSLDDELRERFAREARSAASLKHPNIVTLYDVGDVDGRPFIAMEYIDGETLAEAIRRNAPLSLGRKLQLMMDLCAGLGHAHRNDIVHRDVKPANLMVTADGVLKILDFGIARITTGGETGLTRTGMMMGTPHYMSPEQVEGTTVDRRSDIFAVGLVCYELLSYRKAYAGNAPHEVLYKIMYARPQPLSEVCPGLAPGLCEIVEKAMSKAPGERYQDLDAFGADLSQIRSQLDLPAEAPTVMVPRPPGPGGPHAGAGTILTPSGPATGPARPNLQEIARKRKDQIDGHLREAEAHIAAGAPDAAVEACEQAAQLDLDDERVKVLVQRARSLRDRQREEEREAERARPITAALARARASLAEGAFEAAARAARQALTYDASHAEARDLKAKAEPALGARATEEKKPAPATGPRVRLALAAVAGTVAVMALAGYWWWGPQGGGPDVEATLSEASTRFQQGRRREAIRLAAGLSTDPLVRGQAEDLLASFRETAADEASAARGQAVLAGVPVTNFVAGDGSRDQAEASADTETAVDLYEEATAEYVRLAAAVASPAALVDLATAALTSGNRARAIDLSLQALARDARLAGATSLLQSIRNGARGRATAARGRAAAGGENDSNFATAEQRMTAAGGLSDPADTARAVALYEDAERLYGLSESSAASVTDLLRQGEDARRAGDGAQAIALARQVQARDGTNQSARDLVAAVIRDADRGAAAARSAAESVKASDTQAFRRGESRLADARRATDPLRQLEAFGDAAAAFREAEANPPVPDPLPGLRTLLADAEVALGAGRLGEAERLLAQLEAGLGSAGVALAPADTARRTGLVEGIRAGRDAERRQADLAAIQAALAEYKNAYESLNIDRLLAVAPFLSSGRTQLEATFRGISRLTLQLTTQEPSVAGDRATVGFTTVLSQQTSSAGSLPPIRREGQFVLARTSAGGWAIEAMNVR